jgi:DNA replication protein DnaC
MNVNELLMSQLKDLHLPAFREQFEPMARRAERECWSFEKYLSALAQFECDARSTHRVERFLKMSRLPIEKSMDNFDLNKLPTKLRRVIPTLAQGTFLDRCENVLAFGRPGSGKTHALCALSQELIRAGRKVYFRPCSLLVQDLLIAKRDLKLSRVLKQLGGFDAILIDDIGYVQQSREEMEVLFTLLADRYERGSIMITSNLPFSQWDLIFKDPMTTAAAIDRLVHHSVILEFNRTSHRIDEAQRRQQQDQAQNTTVIDSNATNNQEE